MKHSTIVKRCDNVKKLVCGFYDYLIEDYSSTFGCTKVTFRYDFHKRFIGETEIKDIEVAKKMLGSFYYVIDCLTSKISFYYE